MIGGFRIHRSKKGNRVRSRNARGAGRHTRRSSMSLSTQVRRKKGKSRGKRRKSKGRR